MPDVDYHGWTHRPKALGGTDPVRLGRFAIACFAIHEALDGNLPDSAILVVEGDGKGWMHVPPDLDGARLFEFEAGVGVAASGDIEITVFNKTQAVDMLDTVCVIPSGDLTSFPPAVTEVDTTNNQVAAGDLIWFNVDDDGGGDGEGLIVYPSFG